MHSSLYSASCQEELTAECGGPICRSWAARELLLLKIWCRHRRDDTSSFARFAGYRSHYPAYSRPHARGRDMSVPTFGAFRPPRWSAVLPGSARISFRLKSQDGTDDDVQLAVREGALRMLAESGLYHANRLTAIRHVAGLLGTSQGMLWLWQRKAEVDSGERSG